MLGATKMEELQINISRISVAQELDILQNKIKPMEIGLGIK